MKKSKEQVKRFLSAVRLASEKDEYMIRHFLNKRKIKAPEGFCRTSEYDTGRGLTFDQFEAWFASDMPDIGDVAWCDTTKAMGLVTGEAWDSFTVGALLRANGEFSMEPLRIPKCTWEKANSEQIAALQKALAAHGWEWSPTKSDLIRRSVPTAPKFVRLTVMGREVGIGIFKAIQPDGTLEMVCVGMGDGPLRWSGNLNLGDADAFGFAETYPRHRAAIQQELAEGGYIWNARCQRLQKNNARAQVGTKYYWVSSCLEIKPAVEKNSARDTQRFVRGNYFLNFKVAERVRDRALDLFKQEMLSEDNI